MKPSIKLDLLNNNLLLVWLPPLCDSKSQEIVNGISPTIALSAPPFEQTETLVINLLDREIWQSLIKAYKHSWILFLNQGEQLRKRQCNQIQEWIRSDAPPLYECLVEKAIPGEDWEIYGWVTTRDIFKYGSPDYRRYYKSELRLVPISQLEKILIRKVSSELDTGWLVFPSTSTIPTIQTDILISRIDKKKDRPFTESRPSDRKIFLRGHQEYFNDQDFSPRFAWPHTVYHTLRLQHVQDIHEGLRRGLSNPDIVHFTLVYLIRFRHFALAQGLIPFIPRVWYERHPALANSVAMCLYLSGDGEQSLQMFCEALRRFPRDDWIAKNAIKTCILLDQYQKIDPIVQSYKEATGQDLNDDFLAHFQLIHGTLPVKTATVSLCMIVCDEADHLERTIDSARSMVEEIIVVDTGSRDGTGLLAEKLGAKVFYTPWSDDFAAARNTAIAEASCDYVLVLDGDEYISPLHCLESQTLKKLLPLDPPMAFRIAVGRYFNETDWLFAMSEEGNFRVETTSIRLFPRLEGLQYSGCIGETIEPDLSRLRISIKSIPERMFQVIHDNRRRMERVKRKSHIYERVQEWDIPTALLAVQDFSLISRPDMTLKWLQDFFDRMEDRGGTMAKIGVLLGGLLETEKPAEAESFYRKLIDLYPRNLAVWKAVARYLIIQQRFQDLATLQEFNETIIADNPQEMKEFKVFISLKWFMAGDTDRAFLLLADSLESNPFYLFGQALRFYFLMSMGNVEGALSSLEVLFEVLRNPSPRSVDTLEQFIKLVEDLSGLLFQSGYLKERALILAGVLALDQEKKK